MVATAQLEIVQNWPKKDLLNHSCGKRISGSTAALVLLVLAAVLIDFGLTLNVVIGQRAIYGLAPELRSRLNGLFGSSAFVGGAMGSALGGWAYAQGGWSAAAAIGIALPTIALCYFVRRRA
jgi:MFS family permease